jgi:2,4-dienoyl-CoA reductase-like NADH-dependent reductase (Old Yellow Enzyme family)
MTFRQHVEKFLKRTGIRPTVFGRAVARDPRLVFDLRQGREVGPRLRRRIEAWMEEYAQ